MKQNATVIKTEGKIATVEVSRASMCDGCHKQGCSDNCTLYKIFGADEKFRADALNKTGAKAGDVVEVETPDSNVFLSSFLVFILPLIIAVAVYFAAYFIGKESTRALIAFASFIVYFGVLGITERIRKKRAPQLIIVDIVRSADE